MKFRTETLYGQYGKYTADTELLSACEGNQPSQKNMSQMRSTDAHGSVRENAHMNHSVM